MTGQILKNQRSVCPTILKEEVKPIVPASATVEYCVDPVSHAPLYPPDVVSKSRVGVTSDRRVPPLAHIQGTLRGVPLPKHWLKVLTPVQNTPNLSLLSASQGADSSLVIRYGVVHGIPGESVVSGKPRPS